VSGDLPVVTGRERCVDAAILKVFSCPCATHQHQRRHRPHSRALSCVLLSRQRPLCSPLVEWPRFGVRRGAAVQSTQICGTDALLIIEMRTDVALLIGSGACGRTTLWHDASAS
jgi:hypothetical protein